MQDTNRNLNHQRRKPMADIDLAVVVEITAHVLRVDARFLASKVKGHEKLPDGTIRVEFLDGEIIVYEEVWTDDWAMVSSSRWKDPYQRWGDKCSKD